MDHQPQQLFILRRMLSLRLGTKLTLIIAVASVVPTVAASLVGREFVTRRSRAEFERLLADGEVEVRARHDQLKLQVERAVASLANAEDQLIGPILIALARGGIDDTHYRRLVLTTPRVMLAPAARVTNRRNPSTAKRFLRMKRM